MENFDSMALPESLMNALKQMQFTKPTSIQAEAIPHALKGRDVLGSAQTGTGKTGAFGIPLVTWLSSSENGISLILTPTRELAVQVRATLTQLLGRNSDTKTALLIGGEAMGKQLAQLHAKPRIIVGTPGRINDHIERKSLKLHNVGFFILDEIDRMLDIGLGLQVDRIVKFLPKERQTLMFSATLPENIIALSQKYLKDPVRVAVGAINKPIGKIKQEIIEVEEADKYTKLLAELHEREGSIIIFVKTKYGAEKLAVKLCKENHSADAMHGDLRQNKRDRVIQAFRNQKYRIMVATDIAARGLDIPHIEHVINYDLPQCPEDYIHRIGRTARAGAEGSAINLISPLDALKWRAIYRMLNPGEKLPHVASAKKSHSRSRPVQNRQNRTNNGGHYKQHTSRTDNGNIAEFKHADDRPRNPHHSKFSRNEEVSSDGNRNGNGGKSRFANGANPTRNGRPSNSRFGNEASDSRGNNSRSSYNRSGRTNNNGNSNKTGFSGRPNANSNARRSGGGGRSSSGRVA